MKLWTSSVVRINQRIFNISPLLHATVLPFVSIFCPVLHVIAFSEASAIFIAYLRYLEKKCSIALLEHLLFFLCIQVYKTNVCKNLQVSGSNWSQRLLQRCVILLVSFFFHKIAAPCFVFFATDVVFSVAIYYKKIQSSL